MSNIARPITLADREAILAAIQSYLDGQRTGNVKLIAEAFHPEATIHGLLNGELFSGPIQLLYDQEEKDGAQPNLTAQADFMVVTPSLVVVRLELDGVSVDGVSSGGLSFTDVHSVLKVNGKWRIISKQFHVLEG